MIFWIEMSLYILVSLVMTILLVVSFSLSVKNRKLSKLLFKSNVDNAALREKLAELTARGEHKKLEQTEGFVKFISESRDWAFNYIEDAQKAIAELKEYFEMVGFAEDEAQRAELTDRINHLTSLLPKDAKND